VYDFPLAVPTTGAVDAVRTSASGEWALINPGAAWPNKRWPVESFGAVASWIASTYGWTPVVLWGPDEEALADGVVAASGGTARKAPPTRMADILALAREARLIVSGDTGPLHLACAMGTPAVALFGPTTPARNGPWDDRDVSISRYESCPCHYQRTCRQPAQWCLSTITVAEVTRAITRRVEVA
jgi:heptosyltransferase-1